MPPPGLSAKSNPRLMSPALCLAWSLPNCSDTENFNCPSSSHYKKRAEFQLFVSLVFKTATLSVN